MKTDYHKRHDDWEPFDAVYVTTVPRYKTSGMSGDEWRISALVRFYFKGECVFEEGFRNVQTALTRLAALYDDASCPIPDKVIAIEREACDQPSCGDKAVAKYWLKQEFSARGEKLHPDEHSSLRAYRKFCERHLQRGDCGREDSDRNYEPDGQVGPAQAAGWEGDARESAVVHVAVDSLDDLPSAIGEALKAREVKP